MVSVVHEAARVGLSTLRPFSLPDFMDDSLLNIKGARVGHATRSYFGEIHAGIVCIILESLERRLVPPGVTVAHYQGHSSDYFLDSSLSKAPKDEPHADCVLCMYARCTTAETQALPSQPYPTCLHLENGHASRSGRPRCLLMGYVF